MKQMLFFLAHLSVGDIVNVDVGGRCRRARIRDFTDDGFMVELDAEFEQREVFFQQVRRRIVLPWQPRDLHNHLIILRRRNGKKDDYVEDLRVRRALLQRLLSLYLHGEAVGALHTTTNHSTSST